MPGAGTGPRCPREHAGDRPEPLRVYGPRRPFVLSSAWEALPTVLIEALAVGTPVVATDCVSGPREILKDGRYGALVPVGDAVSLAGAIRAPAAPRQAVPQEGCPAIHRRVRVWTITVDSSKR